MARTARWWRLLLYTVVGCFIVLAGLVAGEIIGLVAVALAFHLTIRIT